MWFKSSLHQTKACSAYESEVGNAEQLHVSKAFEERNVKGLFLFIVFPVAYTKKPKACLQITSSCHTYLLYPHIYVWSDITAAVDRTWTCTQGLLKIYSRSFLQFT